MKYLSPELDVIRFEETDILTESADLPIVPAEENPDPENFDGPSKGDF